MYIYYNFYVCNIDMLKRNSFVKYVLKSSLLFIEQIQLVLYDMLL